MAHISPSNRRASHETPVWQNLKQVISGSSGFQRWQLECNSGQLQGLRLEQQVQKYLRETLETLAY